MKFFTPELYLRSGSRTDAAAAAEWEQAVHAYHAHLSRISRTMNERVRTLAEDLCLHDAELLSFQEDTSSGSFLVPSFSPVVATLSLKGDGRIVTLFYLLGKEVGESPPPRGWPVSPTRTHWLSDEIDLAEPREPPLYEHRILWSDGRLTSIPFYDVVIHSFSERDPRPAILRRRKA